MLFAMGISTLDFYSPGFLPWLYFLVPVIATLLWLWPLGLTVGRILNLSGTTLWAYAPLISITAISVLALIFPFLNLTFQAKTVAGIFLILILFSGLILKLQSKLSFTLLNYKKTVKANSFLIYFFAAIFLASTVRFACSIRSPAAFSHSWDSTFHLAAIQKIVETKDGSSLHMSLVPPYTNQFYPTAWHDLVAMLVPIAQGMPTMATNAVVIVVAFLIWPLGIYSLAKQVSESNTFQLLATAASLLIPQFPLAFLWYGTLRPNFLANAFLPVLLNLFLMLIRQAKYRWSIITSLFLILPGLGLSQPNAVFSLALLGLFSACGVLLTWIWSPNSAQNQVSIHRLPPLLATLFVFLGTILCLVLSSKAIDLIPMLSSMRRSTSWNMDNTSVLDSVKQLLIFSAGRITIYNVTYRVFCMLPLGILVLIGLYLASKKRSAWWLVSSWAGSSIFYIACASAHGPWRSYLGGIWYNDMPRTIVLVVIPAIFLLTLAVERLAGLAAVLFGRGYKKQQTASALPSIRKAIIGRLPQKELSVLGQSITVVVLVLCALFGPTTRGAFSNISIHTKIPAGNQDSQIQLIDQDELSLFLKAKQIIPPNAVTIGNPWEGASMLWPLAQRQTYPRRVDGLPTGEEQYLVYRLRHLESRKQVCPILKKQNIRYLLDLRNLYLWGEDGRGFAEHYKGLDITDTDGLGEVVAQVGKARLIHLTYCEDTVK